MSSDDLQQVIFEKIQLDDVLARVKQREGVTRDADAAAVLDMKPGTLAQAKQRNSLPIPQLVDYAARRGVSLDWLLHGAPATPAVADVQQAYNTSAPAAYATAARMHSMLAASGTTMSEENFIRILRLVDREMQQHGLRHIPPGKLEDMLPLAAVPQPEVFNSELFARVWVSVNQVLDKTGMSADPVARAELAF